MRIRYLNISNTTAKVVKKWDKTHMRNIKNPYSTAKSTAIRIAMAIIDPKNGRAKRYIYIISLIYGHINIYILQHEISR